MNDVYQTIRKAILAKRAILIEYDGLPRLLCPHVLGKNRDKTTGGLRGQFLSYQYAGESSRLLYPVNSPQAHQNWRCMLVEKITSAQIIDGPWYSISRHTMPQTCVRPEFIDVEAAGWD